MHTNNNNISHRRTHNLLLITKLLNQRDTTSPFTLVQDTLEQTAKPLLKEYIRRARLSKTHVCFLAFETVKSPVTTAAAATAAAAAAAAASAKGNHGNSFFTFIPCWNKTPAQICQAVGVAMNKNDDDDDGRSSSSSSSSKRGQHYLLVIDSLHPLCTLSVHSANTLNLTQFLSSLIAQSPSMPPQSTSQSQSPASSSPTTSTTVQIPTTTSLVAVYHTDIPLTPSHSSNPSQVYHPQPLSLLSYLATTIITMHSLATLLAAKAAQERSLAPPLYGLDAAKEGVLIGLKPAKYSRHLPPEQKGVILELEHRRKSGRGVKEWLFLPSSVAVKGRTKPDVGAGMNTKENVVTLLDDHPLFRLAKTDGLDTGAGNGGTDQQLAGMTFELGLTDRQKLEREGVVLPYFDAQRDGGGFGPGEGGRILYNIGAEDDFDEEEDEI